jgi:hypothetical protein
VQTESGPEEQLSSLGCFEVERGSDDDTCQTDTNPNCCKSDRFRTPYARRSRDLTYRFMSTCATVETTEIRIAGRTLYVPSADIFGRTIIVTGKWLRVAAAKDEELAEREVVEHPAAFIEQIRKSPLRADILTFAQKLPETEPKHEGHVEWDNWAAVPTASFKDWWEKRLPQESRKNVRRAAKRGVVVKVVEFNDELVRGIREIYNETPTRQGRRFWHFGKDFDTVKRENATYLDRSEFLGAYAGEELIGFIKIIYAGTTASLSQILAKNEHQDKRPINALLAKAVEVCEKRGTAFLLYGKYAYEGNENSPLTEFKRRNGFEEIRYPRYFLPLTVKGRIAIKLGLHRGAKAVLPASVVTLLKHARSQFYRYRYSSSDASASERLPAGSTS